MWAVECQIGGVLHLIVCLQVLHTTELLVALGALVQHCWHHQRVHSDTVAQFNLRYFRLWMSYSDMYCQIALR